jgi:HicA toxin of bacterial toxin-antitoxin,
MSESVDALRRRAGNVSADDLIACALALGWRYVGVGGRGHHKLAKTGRRPLAIPNHQRRRRGTVLGILGELGRDAAPEVER